MATFYSLTKIINRIDELLRPAMEKSFWVRAEISSGRLKSGSFYCDLVQTDDAGAMLASVRCTIWSRDLNIIKDKFSTQGIELKLEKGTVIGILCKVQFHPVYGLSFRGLDMDPAFALGEMELKKRKIIERLTKEDLLEENSKKQLTLLPKRIGLITSEGTAAFHDFTQTLFSAPYGFKLFLANATMQGEKTEQSVRKALAHLQKVKLDLIIICRGGGSKLDLSWLDNEAIARDIVDCSYQVWTGIGHEIDTSVLDIVAAKNFKTPTAIAEELVGLYTNMEHYLEQAKHNIRSAWRTQLENEYRFLNNNLKSFKHIVKQNLSEHRYQLKDKAHLFRQSTSNKLNFAKTHLIETKHDLKNSPLQLIKQEIDELGHRKSELSQNTKHYLNLIKNSLEQNKRNWKIEHLLSKFDIHYKSIQIQRKRLLQGPIISFLQKEKTNLLSRAQALRALDPQKNLERGYALIENDKGQNITNVKNLKSGQKIISRIKDGKIISTIDHVES